MKRRIVFVLASVLLVVDAAASAGTLERRRGEQGKQPTATGTGGAISTVETLASRAGLEVLRRGGNAVDAAVAAAAVLGVTEPFSAGIGGGGFMLVYRAREGRITTIDHRETAPAAMQPDSFFEGGQPLSFDDARFSGLSAGVPGTVRGWAEALDRYGTFSLADALRPAIRVARRGFVVDQVFFDQVAMNIDYFDDVRSTRELFLDADGTPPDVGSVFRNPDLARTYRRIGRVGTASFYRGPLASAIVRAVRTPPLAPDADHTWRPGVMARGDLLRYRAPERPPTHVEYRGRDVFGMGPPSSGGSTVGEALNILEGYDLGTLPREAALHLYLESSRYSFADRNAYIADPDFFDVPLRGLLSDAFATERRDLITDQAAASPVPPGNPYPHDDGSTGVAAPASATAGRSGSTTHITVSDLRGNVVAYTYTIESVGGNGIVVPGRGFLLNNELTDFNFTSTTHPNRVQGGKRPRSSMSPTLVTAQGRPVLALGSPGGSTIITTVLQMLVNYFDFGMTLPESLAAPRLTQRNTTTTLAEPAFLQSPEANALMQRGHRFAEIAEIGAATAIAFLPGGLVQAAAEPTRRGGGSALVENPLGR